MRLPRNPLHSPMAVGAALCAVAVIASCEPASAPITPVEGTPIEIVDADGTTQGFAILIRKPNRTFIHGIFAGTLAALESASGGTWIMDDDEDERVREYHWTLPDGSDSRAQGDPMLIRRSDGTLVHGAFRGPPRLLDKVSNGTFVLDQGTTQRATAIPMAG